MPEMVVHFDVSRERSIAAIQQAMVEEQEIFLVAQKSIETENPGQEDVYEIGTVASVKQLIKLSKKVVRVLVEGKNRAVLKKIEEKTGLEIYNLGTGVGYSVLEIVKNFEEATGVKIPYVIKPRRAGDIATCYSDASKAKRELGWEAEYGIKDMCADSWRWQKNNPNGYDD